MANSMKVLMMALVIVAIMVVQSEPVLSWGSRCGRNAYFARCAKSINRCAPTCSRATPTACFQMCLEGCDCIPGYVFKGPSMSGDCVRRSECYRSLYGNSYYK